MTETTFLIGLVGLLRRKNSTRERLQTYRALRRNWKTKARTQVYIGKDGSNPFALSPVNKLHGHDGLTVVTVGALIHHYHDLPAGERLISRL